MNTKTLLNVTGSIERGEAEAIEGLPLTIEYSNPLSRSHASVTTDFDGKLAFLCGKRRQLSLTHHSAGYVMAGSAMRYDKENWAVNWLSERGIEGRRFSAEIDAREFFDSFPA